MVKITICEGLRKAVRDINRPSVEISLKFNWKIIKFACLNEL